MVRIGIVGIGFMGWAHFSGATRFTDAGKITGSKLKGGTVTTICARSPEKLIGDWTSIQGNYGPRGIKLDLTRVVAFDNYKEMLKSPDIDLIDICLPNEWHEEVAIAALSAGKDVIVEKPIAVDLKAADRIVAAAQKTGRLLMVAQVLPFFPEFKFVIDAIDSGKYGKLLAANFRRLISPSQWSANVSDFQKSGGWGIDLHIHDNHFISLICGLPQQVSARGLLQDSFVKHVHTQYLYDDSPAAVSCVSGGIAAEGLAFASGFEIFFERATLMYSAGTLGGKWISDRPLTLITGGKVTQPKLKGATEWSSPFTLELQAAVDSIKTGQSSRVLSPELARDALKLCHAEAKSIATGKPVRIV